MADLRIDRRQLLKGAGLGAGFSVASAILPSGTVSASDTDAISGTVAWLDVRARRLGIRTPLGVTEVQLSDDAVVWRDERSTLDRFGLNDEVSAEGEASGDSFLAKTLLATMHSLVANVESREDKILYTDSGPVYLNEHSRPQGGPGVKTKPLNKIAPGDRVVVRGRRDTESGSIIAFRVGVEPTS